MKGGDVKADEREELDQQGKGHLENWDVSEVLWRVFRDAGTLSQESLLGLADLELSYYRGALDDSCRKATALLKAPEPSVVVFARCMRMLSTMASGDGERAYGDLVVLKEECEHGMAQQDDIQLFAASVVSALRAECAVMSSLFEFPDMSAGIDAIPVGIKLYFGYLMSMRCLRMGHYREAYGMAYSYLTLVGPRFPGSRTYLYCILASASLLAGRVGRARQHFDKAWQLKDEYGIIMPFVELNYAMLGLTRANREKLALHDEVRRADAMVRSYSKGWYSLRKKMGLSAETEHLTQIECIVSGLVALGWRNKEIARHMLLSENTVKHHLTSVYRKLGVSNRSDLRVILHMASTEQGERDEMV